MKQMLFLLTATIVFLTNAQGAGVTKPADSLAFTQATIDSLDITKNMTQIRTLKFEILRHLRDDRYRNAAFRASIDSGILALVSLTDALQKSIDKNEVLDGKMYLGHLLNDFRTGNIPSIKSRQAIEGYIEVKKLSQQQLSILPAISQLDPSFTHPILKSLRNKEIAGWKESTDYLVCQTFIAHPVYFLQMAFEFPDAACIDGFLPAIAKQTPEELYKYSQATTSALGKKIARNEDELVRLIVKLSGMRQGRVYYPFLDDLYHKKTSIAAIDKTLGASNQVAYYKLLVKTLLTYNDRVTRMDTPIALNALREKVAYSAEMDFVRVINGLHDAPDAVRLKVLETLTPEELYYLCINGEKDLYTSSYLKIYNGIFTKKHPINGYALLEKSRFDHFRRFIKMAGTYNTLDDFLSHMTKEEAGALMHSFIDDLGTTASMEEVIEVANSYASIRNDSLRSFILQQVAGKMETERLADNKLPKIYTLLNTLFLSLDPANKINLTKELGIPDVYQLTQNALKDTTGRIVIQQFFYGDADGKTAFSTFAQWLKQNNWQVTTKKYWIEASSRKGTPVTIYANLPLNNNTNEDEHAQTMLHAYMQLMNVSASIVIHRGHSYYASHTISQLNAGNKLIIMGSCGSFSQISTIYKYSPTAQMITSKQEGSVTVNQPMIGHILNLLTSGKDLNWPEIWDKLAVVFKKNSRFEDYIPPYQNLGAVLLLTGLQTN